MSLTGKRVVVTRAPHQAAKFAYMLRERGAEPLLFPCIDIMPPENTTLLDDALQNAAKFDWLLLTSPNTVVALEKRIDALELDVTTLRSLRVGAVGWKTAREAQLRLGVHVDVVPNQQSAEGLVVALPYMSGKRVFLPQSAIARDVLGTQLLAQGAEVTAVVAYRTVTGSGGVSVDEVRTADVVTFTSPSAVKGFVERSGGVIDLPAVCIGKTTAESAQDTGFRRVSYPQNNFSLTGMLQLMEATLTETVS